MKRNNYILMFVCACLLFAGCGKDLDLFPKDSVSDKSFWKSAADYKLAANNLYLSLEGFSGSVFSPPGGFSDIDSDIAFNVPNSASNGTFQPSETDGNWTNAYIYIRRCNNIVLKAADYPNKEDVKVYVAEAKFFRAYNYWRIFRRYGGVPLITSVPDIDSEELYSPRAGRKETVNLIIKDLTEAAADLPENKSLAAADKGRITKGAANALKARVALFEGTWGKYRDDANATAYLDIAVEASNAVINSGQYALYKGMADDSYRYLFIEPGDDSDECILDRRYQKDISHHTFSTALDVGYLPTKKLADMYLCNDGLPISKSPSFQGYNTPTSEYENRDPRMTMTFMVPGSMSYFPLHTDRVECWPFYPSKNPSTGYTLFKFMSEDVEGLSQLRKLEYDYHIIRYAEVLLIFAEAVFEKSGSIGNADLDKTVNVIRERVNLPALTNEFVLANGLDMKQELRRERTVELAFEGFRWDDLRRWKTAETEMKEDLKGVKIKGSTWTDPILIAGSNRNPYAQEVYQNHTDANGFIIAETGRVFEDKHYLLPLPTKEVAINPKLEQNPGW